MKRASERGESLRDGRWWAAIWRRGAAGLAAKSKSLDETDAGVVVAMRGAGGVSVVQLDSIPFGFKAARKKRRGGRGVEKWRPCHHVESRSVEGQQWLLGAAWAPWRGVSLVRRRYRRHCRCSR